MQYRPQIHLLAAIFLFMGAGGISVSALAESEDGILIENDGVTINVTTPEIENVVALKMRVVGPNGFVFEDRLEGSATEWVPDAAFADGRYRYEVTAVSVAPSAKMRAAPTAATGQLPSPQSTIQSDEGKNTLSESTVLPTREIPVEQLYKAEDKSVHRASGSFRVINNVMEPIEDSEPDDSLTQRHQPGTLGRIASAITGFFIPQASAQLGEFEDLRLEKSSVTGPFLEFQQLDTDGTTSLHSWIIRGNQDRWRLWDNQTFNEPIYVESGAKEFSLYVRGRSTGELPNPFVGIGTSAATTTLHAASDLPRIRLEDLDDASSWYIKASNGGRFEVAETSSGTNPFTIQSGAPDGALHVASNGFVGIGTGAPERNLHILGNHIRIEDTNSTWDLNPGSQGLWFNRPTPGALFGVLKLQNDAPVDSIVANATGVGIGTDSPETPLQVFETTGGDTNMLMLSNDAGNRIYFRNRSAPESGNDSRSWVFSTTEPGFRVSRTFSGTTEMELANNGNLSISGTLSQGSSREIKSNINPLDGTEVLENLSRLEFNEWSYNQAPDQRHAGPMAEDFYSIFGLGPDNRHIAPGDMAGLSLAAIKALHSENRDLKKRLARLEERLTE